MKEAKLLAASWGRSFATAALTCYITWGSLNWKMMMNSGLAAVVPVILRWLNPNDLAFGKKALKKK